MLRGDFSFQLLQRSVWALQARKSIYETVGTDGKTFWFRDDQPNDRLETTISTLQGE